MHFTKTDLTFLCLVWFGFFNSSGKDTRKETGRTPLRSSKRGGNRETDCLGKNSSDPIHDGNVTKYDFMLCCSKALEY